jgi:hypothetical protein
MIPAEIANRLSSIDRSLESLQKLADRIRAIRVDGRGSIDFIGASLKVNATTDLATMLERLSNIESRLSGLEAQMKTVQELIG